MRIEDEDTTLKGQMDAWIKHLNSKIDYIEDQNKILAMKILILRGEKQCQKNQHNMIEK